jgi:ribosome-binding ATPase YchF (GTP1/OBG family)
MKEQIRGRILRVCIQRIWFHARGTDDLVDVFGFGGKTAYHNYTAVKKEIAAYSKGLTKKLMIVAANKMDLPTAKANIAKLKKEFPQYLIVPVSAESELALREAAKKNIIKYIPGDNKFEITKKESLSESQHKALNFIQTKILNIWGSTGMQQCLNSAVFDFLKHIVVFPGGVHKLSDAQGRVLPDAFILPPGSTAYDFAAKIHTDFAKNFIAAINVKTKQKIGRDAKLQNLDVIEIISGR